MMRFWITCRDILPLITHRIRYERLVEDAEPEMRSLAAFLGLDWTDRVLDNRGIAKDRGFINTPSYAQVVEPLYDRSIGRWENDVLTVDTVGFAPGNYLNPGPWRIPHHHRTLLHYCKAFGVALEPFIRSITEHPPVRVPGTAVFLTATQEGVPHALLHNLNHNKVLHERVLLLTVRAEDIPHVPDAQRLEVMPLGNDFYRLIVHYGFKDEPDLPRALELASSKGLEFNMMETSFFLSRQTLVPTQSPGMALWREKLFAAMSRNAASATVFFKIPTNRVVELGTRIEL